MASNWQAAYLVNTQSLIIRLCKSNSSECICCAAWPPYTLQRAPEIVSDRKQRQHVQRSAAPLRPAHRPTGPSGSLR